MRILLSEPSFIIKPLMTLDTFLNTFPIPFPRPRKKYYWARCISHGDLQCMIGFHFEKYGKISPELILWQIEFYRESYQELSPGPVSYEEGVRISFDDFQRRFEAVYGIPEIVRDPSEYPQFPAYRWRLPEAEIYHCLYDRFCLEEHLLMSFVNQETRLPIGQ